MDRTSSKNRPEIRGPGSVVVCVRHSIQALLSRSLLGLSSSRVYSCTSNGALRFTPLGEPDAEPRTAALPMRLCEWRLAPERKTFAYGGDEVELSVWDLEAAFTTLSSHPEASSKKRKRGNDLLPGELWRAKNARRIICSSRAGLTRTSSIVVGRERLVELATARA
jgi:ribosome biogenesis protein NSA1